MIKRVAALLLFLNFSLAYAQTTKIDVLVIGGTPSGVAAAIQSARSKVKTILIDPNPRLFNKLTGSKMLTIEAGRNLSSGIWGEFKSHVIESYQKTKGYDTSYNAPLQLSVNAGADILTKIADTVKNIIIKLNTQFISIKKDNDRWEVVIKSNGKTETIKSRVIIDATENGEAVTKVGATYPDHHDNLPTSYRTSATMDCLPMKALLAKGADNLLITGKISPVENNIENLPTQLAAGQGAGVIAAYCAFFKTTTAKLKVRIIQGELLDFKGYLLPLADINADPYWRAIQQVCATGLLKGKSKMINNQEQFTFMPDSAVTTAEVKPVLLEIYTRGFLWFGKEKPGKGFTVGNLLSFISELTLTDPDNLEKSIAKNWKAQYKFKSEFDLDRPITRREFAILANQYLNPFGRAVDLDGRMVN